MVRTMHLGMARNSETIIRDQLLACLTTPRKAEDGTDLPPFKHQDIVVYLAHRDDPSTHPIIVRHCENEDLEVAVFVTEREVFAKKLMEWKFIHCKECGRPNLVDESITMCACGAHTAPGKVSRPYREMARELLKPAPPMTVWVTVFGIGIAHRFFIGFDPQNLETNKVESDPNFPKPEPLFPMEVVPKEEMEKMAAKKAKRLEAIAAVETTAATAKEIEPK